MKKAVLAFFIISYLILLFTSCGGDNPAAPPKDDPVIDSLSKNHGEIGAIIDIFGNNFGSSANNGYVEFTGARTSTNDILTWTNTKLSVKVPTNAKTGKLFVNTFGKNSNQLDFTVDSFAKSEPYIISINPASFSLGDRIEINGRNFGANQMASYVEFARGARPVTSDYKSWEDNKIILNVPTSIDASGKLFVSIRVESNFKKSNEIDYRIIGFPYINDVNPDSVPQGNIMTINGSGFGASKGSGYVYFGGFQGQEYPQWSDAMIKVKVPLNLSSDTIEVRRSDMKRSNKFYVKFLPPELPPEIDNINPNPATAGQNITIQGRYFGPSQSNSIVKINNDTCKEFSSWTSTQIIVRVPVTASSGPLIIKVNNLESEPFNITVQQPQTTDPRIDYIDVQSAVEGQSIGINGVNFGDTRNSNFVEFNGLNADPSDYISWSDTRIVVRVPVGTTSGLVKVHVDSKTSNGVNLNIQGQNYIVPTVSIPAGTFKMGSSTIEEDGPQHDVTISYSFYMSKYEITQLEWKTVMDNSDPSFYKNDKNPVEQVDWYRVIEFCNRLSKIVGLDTCYTINGTNVTCNWNANGFRLPTEAEWEYACRAGTTDNYAGNIDDLGWTSSNSGNTVHNAGTKQPNAFGLYDMHGNILEWCWDWYDSEYYKTRPNPDIDPRGPSAEFPERVVRGGSFSNSQIECSSPKRDGRNPVDLANNRGFRIVRKK
ncbi:MAG: SUMF1/EgtB/PvdO family nonheme iron enzyme [Ignavibacteriae bacterium]|nr:SUMF1/EgtB/PvdO family nonheme iron enzyme [Ignavibacteriota bacterium]